MDPDGIPTAACDIACTDAIRTSDDISCGRSFDDDFLSNNSFVLSDTSAEDVPTEKAVFEGTTTFSVSDPLPGKMTSGEASIGIATASVICPSKVVACAFSTILLGFLSPTSAAAEETGTVDVALLDTRGTPTSVLANSMDREVAREAGGEVLFCAEVDLSFDFVKLLSSTVGTFPFCPRFTFSLKFV